jgi:hypothetical protein
LVIGLHFFDLNLDLDSCSARLWVGMVPLGNITLNHVVVVFRKGDRREGRREGEGRRPRRSEDDLRSPGAPRARAVEIGLPEVNRYGAADAIIAGFGAISTAIVDGTISPAEATEPVAVLNAHRAAIVELQPSSLGPEPTPEDIERRRRAAERQAEVDRSTEAILDQMMGCR